MINIKDKSRIYWACRRGMLELDIIIMCFFKKRYDFINDNEKKTFIRLLGLSDILIKNYLLNTNYIYDKNFKKIIYMIKKNKIYSF